jgi:hypothetical protein
VFQGGQNRDVTWTVQWPKALLPKTRVTPQSVLLARSTLCVYSDWTGRGPCTSEAETAVTFSFSLLLLRHKQRGLLNDIEAREELRRARGMVSAHGQEPSRDFQRIRYRALKRTFSTRPRLGLALAKRPPPPLPHGDLDFPVDYRCPLLLAGPPKLG